MHKDTLSKLDEAARLLGINADIIETLRSPRESTQARLTIRMDDGSKKSFLAWRCRYDDTRGPTKGGIRFHPDSNAEEVETLAFWMTFKCAVMNLPYGGSKGAVKVDPHSLSKSELEKLSRSYVRAFHHVISPDRDIPAPDVYTNAMIMGWMADEFSQIAGKHQPAAFTGKPVALGGTLGRSDATAYGGYYLIRHLAPDLGLGKVMKVAVQGFGNAGQHTARLLAADGHKIVAVSDSKGALHCPDGLDIAALTKAKSDGGSVTSTGGKEHYKSLTPDEFLSVDCDLLIPSAMAGMIHEGNASRVEAKFILELANGPITPEADKILVDRGVIILPDILANAGGVTVSYFEWVQNRQGICWTIDDIRERLRTAMERESQIVWKLSKDKRVTMRSAAYVHGLGRILDAINAQGD